MKKVHILIVLAAMFICTSAVAEVVTTRRAVPATTPASKPAAAVKPVVTSRLASSVKSCTPYSESLNSSLMGMDFNFNIQILGWVNDKCTINFKAKSTGMSGLLKSLYGSADISDVQIQTYEPVAKCAFTKQQLQSVGDSILQEQARKNGAAMLKDPNSIDLAQFGNMSSNDRTLMDIIFNQGACNISNGSSSPLDYNGLDILGF